MSWFSENKDEIKWNLINSFLAGLLVFMGSLASAFKDGITQEAILFSLGVSFVGGGLVAVTKFKDYWTTQEKEIANKLFNFI